MVNGKVQSAILDTGCSRTVVSRKAANPSNCVPTDQQITMMNGDRVRSLSSSCCVLQIGEKSLNVDCLVSNILPGCGVLLGMDVIKLMGGVFVRGDRRITFESASNESEREYAEVVRADSTVLSTVTDCVGTDSLRLSDKDFEARFEAGEWVVSWKWVDGDRVPKLRNQIDKYCMTKEVEQGFSEEVREWVKEGWLVPFKGESRGIVPLMAVVQENKDKIRPVMDFRELNSYVSSHTGQSVVCGDKIRRWRRLGDRLSIVDLKKAYLQIKVDQQLWPFQIVKFEGETFALTRLGFGLNVAPKIMSAIVAKVLSMDEQVQKATDSYIDDIIINESMLSPDRVVSLLNRYGLETKAVENLVGARVLGLQVYDTNGEVWWKRGNTLSVPDTNMTKREVFSWCGRLTGHFPIASWLRPACSYLKRLVNDLDWEETISFDLYQRLKEIWDRVASNDPVKGVWAVDDWSTADAIVYCDASSIATGIALMIGGKMVEDACWLRKPSDHSHINLAELEAVVRGVNLACSWGITQFKIITDSKTVHGWLKNVIDEDSRVRTSALSDMLIRRRLGLLRDLITECSLDLTVSLVPSAENKADPLTRVPKKWLSNTVVAAVGVDASNREQQIRQIHDIAHCGTRKTQFLVEAIAPELHAKKQEIDDVIKTCQPCNSIDPSPIRWEAGHLHVEGVWNRLSCDVTHYQNGKFLTVVDSGPGRFAIWKRITSESVAPITEAMNEVFCEFGPPNEILLDNGASFRSGSFTEMCDKWGVKILYRAAYRPSGNGICERNHRTIKRMAARTGKNIPEVVYLYNLMPREEGRAPQQYVFCSKWTCRPWVKRREESSSHDLDHWIGEEVFVKPAVMNCVTPWPRGRVTGISEQGGIEVNGIPRHVADVRRISQMHRTSQGSREQEEEGGETQENENAVRRSERITARPWRFDGAEYDRLERS